MFIWGFLGSSVGKESTWNAEDPSLIPGLGTFTGEGIDYPLQYFWASLVGQMAKNPPAMCETWVLFLDWEDPLEEGIATHSSILVWRIPMDRGAWRATQSMGLQRVRHDWVAKHSTVFSHCYILLKEWKGTLFQF